MTISQRIRTFADLPVVEFDPDSPGGATAQVADPTAVAWRISVTCDDEVESFERLLQQLISAVGGPSVTALVIGEWGSSYDSGFPVEMLARSAAQLSNLRALFIGEMTYEECEISWINQDDVTGLLEAYPGLEVLRVRGGTGLQVRPVRHERLRELAFETGGLPGAVVRAVGACEFPAMERLELWLGSDNYGGDTTVEDLTGILSGARLPILRSLGLRDAEIADEVADAVASAPVVARLDELDLSLGALSDAGVEALLTGQPLTHLRRLNLSHHFITDELIFRLRAELPGVEIARMR